MSGIVTGRDPLAACSYPVSCHGKAQLGISGRDGRVINELIAFPRRPAGTNPPIYELDIGIKITPNGLGGGLYMTTYESNVVIAADDAGIWTASGYSSDNPRPPNAPISGTTAVTPRAGGCSTRTASACPSRAPCFSLG